MTERSIVYGTFTIERQYDASPKRAFAAWADPSIKGKWFGGGEAGATTWEVFEFRVGGREYNAGKGPAETIPSTSATTTSSPISASSTPMT